MTASIASVLLAVNVKEWVCTFSRRWSFNRSRRLTNRWLRRIIRTSIHSPMPSMHHTWFLIPMIMDATPGVSSTYCWAILDVLHWGHWPLDHTSAATAFIICNNSWAKLQGLNQAVVLVYIRILALFYSLGVGTPLLKYPLLKIPEAAVPKPMRLMLFSTHKSAIPLWTGPRSKADNCTWCNTSGTPAAFSSFGIASQSL
jgi:hypothetical protein